MKGVLNFLPRSAVEVVVHHKPCNDGEAAALHNNSEEVDINMLLLQGRKRGHGRFLNKLKGFMFTPIQFIKGNVYTVAVIPTDRLDEFSGVERGGTFLHGPACSAEEALKYNEGFLEGMTTRSKYPVIKIDAEKKTITTTKKRKIKK